MQSGAYNEVEMKLTGLAIVIVLLLAGTAWAGDCGSCGGNNGCDKCHSSSHPQHCDACGKLASGDMHAGGCCDKTPCGECGHADCCKQHMREDCLPVPVPEDGCWKIDPECCPRDCYRLLCVEREEFRLLCPEKCAPRKTCDKCRPKCNDDCENGLEITPSE
jgi:hypothetical protein